MASEKTVDLVRRGTALYEQRLRAELEAEHWDEFVAIEPDSGDYFLGPTLSAAIQAANAVYPDRLPFAMRVGHAAAVHIGVLDS